MSGDYFKTRLNPWHGLSRHTLIPLPVDTGLLTHLLVLAFLRGEPLQHAALPNGREVLPEGAVARCGHGAAPGCPISSSCTSLTGCPVHTEVHTCFTDVATNRLASDLPGDDGGAVRLVQWLWGIKVVLLEIFSSRKLNTDLELVNFTILQPGFPSEWQLPLEGPLFVQSEAGSA